jgi:hypothetical protein
MASIKCAHCKDTHTAVAAVRACAEAEALRKFLLQQENEQENEIWAQFKLQAAAREAAEERAAYEAEMRRDEMLADGLEYGIGPMR